MTQKLPQICTVILRIRIGKVAWFAVYICGNFWVTQYIEVDKTRYCKSKKSWPISYSSFLYKMGQWGLDIIVQYWFAVTRFIKNLKKLTRRMFLTTLMSAWMAPRNGFHVILQYWFKRHDFNTIPGWLILRGYMGAAQGAQGGKQVSRGPFSSSDWRTCVDFSYVITIAAVIQQDSLSSVFVGVVSVLRCFIYWF